MDTDKLRS